MDDDDDDTLALEDETITAIRKGSSIQNICCHRVLKASHCRCRCRRRRKSKKKRTEKRE